MNDYSVSKVHSLSEDEISTIARFGQYGRYIEDKDFSIDSAALILSNQIQSALPNEHSVFFILKKKEELKGLLMGKFSQWDTEHFGFPMAALDLVLLKDHDYENRLIETKFLLSAFQRWLAEKNIKFVSTRVPSLDLAVIHALEQEQFSFIESWVYSKYNLHLNHFDQTPPTLRYAKPEDKPFMLRYAKGAFATQRFHADSKFSKEKADDLYEKWVSTAFDDPHQKIAVLDVDGVPAAFMIYFHQTKAGSEGHKYAMWKFTVIDPALRGRGVGQRFFDGLKAHHKAEGMDYIESGVSLRNLASMNLHNKLQFKIIASLVTFHKWMN
jgi:GNAT superfamily N-acetyltransferase